MSLQILTQNAGPSTILHVTVGCTNNTTSCANRNILYAVEPLIFGERSQKELETQLPPHGVLIIATSRLFELDTRISGGDPEPTFIAELCS